MGPGPATGITADREAERALATALEAAREAGEILLSHLGRIERADVHSKSAARDLVTAADLACERAIVARLRADFPGDAIEAEEEVRDARGSAPRWFVDPLDGTVNFVHGIPAFAVSIARWRGDAPEVAVVHAPRLGETFSARRGAGAALDGRPIRVSDTAELGAALVATGFPYRRNELRAAGIPDNLDHFRRMFYEVRGLRRLGSAALDLAYTAAGRFDGFWELHLSPHDVAAGALLVLEAGGIVTDLAGGGDWLRGGSVCAGGAAIQRSIRERLGHPAALPPS